MKTIDLTAKPFYLNNEQLNWVEETFAALTEKEKIGQLFCLMAGDYSDDEQDKLVSEYAVGGLLFRPIQTKRELQAKYDRLDKVSRVPLLKAANLEEGAYGGFSDGVRFAFPEGVAATGELSMVEKFAKATVKDGIEAGINWTFSPVSDIDINYRNPITNIRTYGSNQAEVMAYTRQFVETVQENGMAACAKHYPGDGVDYRDQHLHPTYNTLSAKEWYDSYGAIYKNMIDGDLLSIMVGHIVQPNVERDINPDLSDEQLMPGSLSKELLQGVLREKYSFNGVITTDATIMGGFTMALNRRAAMPSSIMAGIDMIVFTPDFYQDYQYMLDALENGALTKERLDEAVYRILGLKAKVALAVRPAESDDFVCSRKDIEEWTLECADKAVTLVKNKRDILPVAKGRYDKVKLINLGKDETPEGSLQQMVVDYLKAEGLEVEIYDPFADDLHSPEKCDNKTLTLYIACREAESNVTAVRLFWCPKHALDTPRFVNEEDSVFISFGNPYLLQDVPRIPVYINAYTAGKATVNASLDKIFGKSEFKGKSPVDAFCGLMDTRL